MNIEYNMFTHNNNKFDFKTYFSYHLKSIKHHLINLSDPLIKFYKQINLRFATVLFQLLTGKNCNSFNFVARIFKII